MHSSALPRFWRAIPTLQRNGNQTTGRLVFFVFSAICRHDRFEVGRRRLTGGLAGGFVFVTGPFGLDRCWFGF